MAAPNLHVTIEPFEDGNVVYERLAAATVNDAEFVQISLVLSIRNDEAVPVDLTQWMTTADAAIPFASKTKVLTMTLAPGETQGIAFETADNVTFAEPAPPTVTVALTATGFAQPWTHTWNLKPHHSPIPGDAYLFPASSADLESDERWIGIGGAHASGYGSQLFAHDFGVVRFDEATSSWVDKHPGTDGSKNEHFLVWGKPIYAMADGVVVGFINNIPTNPTPGITCPEGTPVEGSSFWIAYGTEVGLHAHFQAETMNPDLLSIGAIVHERQFLGNAGNSGNSFGPHHHTHIMKGNAPWGGPLRPFPYRRCQVLSRAAFDPNGPNEWVDADVTGIPVVESLIRPDLPIRKVPIRLLIDAMLAILRRILHWLHIPIGPDPVPDRFDIDATTKINRG
jgi:hypothetical protein